MRRIKVAVTTAADGTAVAYSPRLSGKVHQIEYVKNDFADGVDFAITGEQTGVNLWTESNVNASAVKAPRMPTHTQAGAASLFATGGTAVQEAIGVGNDRIKFVIAQGGASKKGTFHVLLA